jgi:hypothetical protein
MHCFKKIHRIKCHCICAMFFKFNSLIMLGVKIQIFVAFCGLFKHNFKIISHNKNFIFSNTCCKIYIIICSLPLVWFCLSKWNVEITFSTMKTNLQNSKWKHIFLCPFLQFWQSQIRNSPLFLKVFLKSQELHKTIECINDMN